MTLRERSEVAAATGAATWWLGIALHEELHLLQLHPPWEPEGIVTREARIAEGIVKRTGSVADSPLHPVYGQVFEGIRRHILVYLLYLMRGGDQLRPGRRVDPVKAGKAGGRRGDPEMYLLGPLLAQHGDDLPARGRPHYRVVDHDDPLPLHRLVVGIQLQLYPEMADRLLWLDERPPYVMVPHKAHLERNARGLGITDGGAYARVGYGDHHVRFDAPFPCKLSPEGLPHAVHGPAVYLAVRPGEVDIFKDAAAGLHLLEREIRTDAVFRDVDHLSRLHLSQVVRLDQVESARLAGDRIGVLQLSEDQGPEAVGITDGDHLLVGEEQQRIGAFDPPQGADEPVEGQILMGEGDEVDDHLRVHGRLEDGPVILQLVPNDLCVGEVPVVGYREGAFRILDDKGLGVLEGARSRGRIPHVPYGRVPLDLLQPLLVEYVGDKTHLPAHVHGGAVGAHYARAFLSPVLEGMEPQVDEVGCLAVVKYAEYAAHGCFRPLLSVIALVQTNRLSPGP